MFNVFRAESKHLYKKESPSGLCCLFCLFWSAFFFLKVFCLMFFIKDSIFGIFCLQYVSREKNISHLFICRYWCFLSHFPCQLCPLTHWIFKFFSRFFSFVLISCKKSRKSGSHICDPSKLAQSSFRTKKPCGKWLESLERRMRCFQKNVLPALRVNPF